MTGSVPPAAVERAIDLSREKYCSVWHSMRQDIELATTSPCPTECDSRRDDRARARAQTRRTYLDWLRGIAVLLMIEAHLFDSWLCTPAIARRSCSASRYRSAAWGASSS